jgi:ArsR family transcriptional regulator
VNRHKTPIEYETKIADLHKVLSHPVRIAILQILSQDEACVCHMEAALGYRQSYLSQQLAVLRKAEIIVDRRDGWNVYYQIQDKRILDFISLSQQFLRLETSLIPAKPHNCPCPKCNPSQIKGSCSNHS